MLSLMSSVFNQVNARKYYQPATAGLGYSLSIGTRCALCALTNLYNSIMFYF